jgi:Protein of unknown function (DUF1595)/Protein of unknown function (DUF1592)/Protein of unknown function (DUF1588)/Protein of unknown function (DUF1585)/Protein of unknown function (DUF1587)
MRTKLPHLLLPSILLWGCSGTVNSTPSTDFDPVGGGTSTSTTGPGPVASSPNPAASNPAPGATGPGQAPVDTPPPPPNADNDQPSGTDLQGTPIYTRFSRLTNAQWAASVRDLLKLPSAPEPTGLESPVQESTDFLNNERILEVTSTQNDGYALLTQTLLEQVSTDAAIAKIYSGTDADGFIKTFGRRAYRRPLTDAEVSKYQALFESGSALEGDASAFTKGAMQVIHTMLQSPHFIYRVEAGQANQALTGYEIAAKLSLWLLNTAPSDALLDKAETLTNPAAVGAEAKSMLEQPAATEVMREFFYEWMNLKRYGDINKDPALGLPEGIGDELKELSAKYFDRIYSEGLGLKEIMTGTQGFVGPKTAALYGVQASSVTLQDFGAERTGFFAQVPYNLLYGGYSGQSDIIHRGAHLQHELLCGILEAAPAVFALPEAQPNQSNRQRVELMTSGGICADCHVRYVNPLGFAFENFDGLGRIRTQDNGAAVDTTGTYAFPEKTAAFTDHKSLMEAAYASEMSHICFSKRIASFGLGRDIVANDTPLLTTLASTSQSNGSVKDLIVQLVESPSFTQRTGEAP